MLLDQGLKALKEKRFSEAIELLTQYCQEATNTSNPQYSQAQMMLVQAYHQNGQLEQALSLCQQLQAHLDSQVSLWATEYQKRIRQEQKQSQSEDVSHPEQAGRGPQKGIKLAMKGIAGSLALASTTTLSLLLGMVLVLCLSVVFILDSESPGAGLLISLVITLVFSLISFLLSPVIMDLIQSNFYQTRWVSLETIRNNSPESAEVIEQVCREKKLQLPRLGIIEDANPTTRHQFWFMGICLGNVAEAIGDVSRFPQSF